MKLHLFTLAFVSVMLSPYAEGLASVAWPSGYSIKERGPHHTRWERLTYVTNEDGTALPVSTNAVVLLGTGLNRWTGSTWTEATPQLLLTNNGVLGTGAQATAFFVPNLAGPAPVRVWMPSGQGLAFRLFGLAYHDVSTGTNLLLAAPKDRGRQIFGTNFVAYLDALDDLKCDIRYSYDLDGIRQHVILRECPEPPSAYGLSNATTYLLVISELIEGPAPGITERTWPAGLDVDRDQTLDFAGSMRMVPGRAFNLPDTRADRGVPVTKQFEVVGSRRLIVERVRYPQVRNELMRLPPAGLLMTNSFGGTVTNASLPKPTRWFADGTLPSSRSARLTASASPQPDTILAALPPKPGFVLDWELVSDNYYGFTFDCSATWYIYNATHISPWATFTPGAVVKYYYGASLYIDGMLNCPDSAWPCMEPGPILTSGNDDTVGEVFNSTGSPADGDYGPALVVACGDLPTAQHHIEVRYANPGIIASGSCYSTIVATAPDSVATKGAEDHGTFRISRADGDWSQSINVLFSLNGSAQAGLDYLPISTSATIPGGAGSVDIDIIPMAPGLAAPVSTVVLTLEPDSAYTLGSPSSGAVTILDPSVQHPPGVPAAPGLICWWRAENDPNDSAGTVNGVLANGLGFGLGEVGQGFNFDGVDDRFTAAATAPGSVDFGAGADFSIEAWIQPIQAYTTYGVETILDKRIAPPGDYEAVGYAMWLIDGKLGCELADNPMAPYTLHNYGPAGPDLRDGLFHHVAMTVDRDSATGGRLYVDGNLVLTFDPTSEPGDLSNAGPLRVGNHANIYISCFFKGIIDEVSLYNRALSWTEVQQVFKAGQAGKALGTLASPVFTPVGGSYTTARDVALACPNPGATLHYTLDGQEPAESSPTYSGTPVHVHHNLTLKAKAWKSGWLPSGTESESYRIERTPSDLPPTISISPSTGTAYLASQDIDLLVEASDPDGSVSRLKLFLAGYQVAEVAGSPLRYKLPKVAAGIYSFSAKAVDDQGFVTVSSPVVFTVTAPGPSIALCGQQPLFTSSPGALVASVTGVNPGALASLTLNGSPVPVATGTFTLTPALAEGENTFTLLATDAQNHTAQATTKVYLDSVHPVIAITAPANNYSFATTRINVTGTFTESSLKEITINGVPAFVSRSTFEALNVPLAVGANTITAQAEDLAGNVSIASINIMGAANPVDPVQLQATPVSGFASLQVTFTAQASVPGTLQQVLYDFTGNQATFQSATDIQAVSHTYATAGEYFPVVTLVTSTGRFSSSGGWNGAANRLRVNAQCPPVLVSTINVTDPVDLRSMPDGSLYVLSRSTATMTAYDVTQTPPVAVRSISGLGATPTGLDVDDAGNVYVVLNGRHQVAKYKYDPATSAFELDISFGRGGWIGRTDQNPGSANGEFNCPYGVAIDPAADLIAVSDSGNHRVQFFTRSGAFSGLFGGQGSGVGQLNTPKGLRYSSSGYLYIVDSGNNRIVLTLSGEYIGTSGATGNAAGQFQAPVGVAIGNRSVYISDAGNNRVQRFDSLQSGAGAQPTPLVPHGALSTELNLSGPNAVATVPDLADERVYIADTAHNRIVLVRLPFDSPEAVWTSMKQQLVSGNSSTALAFFCVGSAERYRQQFLSMNPVDLAGTISQIPNTIIPVFVEDQTAQYRFEQMVSGRTLSFPIDFVKENGVWKILEF